MFLNPACEDTVFKVPSIFFKYISGRSNYLLIHLHAGIHN